MRKNGFIATSILYSFFLVFITLFVALITNYLHNRVLLNAMDEIARDTLDGIKNTKFSDMEVGDSIRFANNPSPTSSDGRTLNYALNDNAQWIVIDAKQKENSNDKTYYLLSDFTAQNAVVTRRMPGDIVPLRHSVTIDVMNYLSNTTNPTFKNGYRDDIQFYSTYSSSTAKPYSEFEITIPKASILAKVRNSTTSDEIKDAIFGVNGSYAVYLDGNFDGFNKFPYKYALLRRYNFLMKDKQEQLVPNYCGATFTGGTLAYQGNNAGENGFGYTHVVKEFVTASKTVIPYVDYCVYASPIVYTHEINEAVVSTNEEQDDIIRDTNSAVTYQYRLMAKITVDVTSENTYIESGRGTSIDPYLILNGVKKS